MVGAVESRDINLVDLDLLVLIDIHVDDDAVVGRDVLFLHDFHGGVFIALALEVTLDDVLGAVGEVGGELAAGMEVNLLLEFLALALFHAVVVDGGDAGLGGELDVEVDFAAHDAVGQDADVGEQFLLPVAHNGLADFRPGHLVGFAHGKSRNAEQQIVVEPFDAINRQACKDIARAVGRVIYVGLHLHGLLRKGTRRDAQS